jgi:hypothetical protein
MKVLRVIAVLVCVASLALAADVWDKESKSWDRNDAEKVLFDSPWGKQKATAQEYRKDQSGGVGSRPGSVTTGSRQSDSSRLTSETDRGEALGTDIAKVVWWSARTPRRAYLRIAELAGQQISSEQSKIFAETPTQNLVIALWGGGKQVALAMKLKPEELMAAAWLETPRQKKLMPVRAEVMKDGAGRPDRVVFEFPRETAGQPTVTPQDKKITFKWKLPKEDKETVDKAKQFDVSFQPSKMFSAGQADL